MTVALPANKVGTIQRDTLQLLTMKHVQIKTLAHFIGTLVATKPAIPLSHLHFRGLQDMKIQTLHQHQASYSTSVHLSQETQKDLQ